MFLRSKFQEFMLRRSGGSKRTMSGGGGGGGGGGGKQSNPCASSTGGNGAKKPFLDLRHAGGHGGADAESRAFSDKAADRRRGERRRRQWRVDDSSKAVGLGLLHAVDDDGAGGGNGDNGSKTVLFGTQLRKRRLSPAPVEMEFSSEDYTCIIVHGSNPTTRHIFGEHVVIECNGHGTLAAGAAGTTRGPPPAGFLSSCHGCKKTLPQGKDIFMYRGERAFCSRECRCSAMLLDEQLD